MAREIFVNQIGYKINGIKTAFVLEQDLKSNYEFELKDLDGNVVYSGVFEVAKEDRIAGAPYCRADFSEFSAPGEYTLCSGKMQSYPFKIADQIYDEVYLSSLNYFTLSRCGHKVQDKIFGHEPCHTTAADVYGQKGKEKKVIGGWHDAGDYGRYVVAGTKTVLDFLCAYKAHTESKVKFDLLDEVKFELDWLLQMQREDGAVYHKITCYKFCGFVVPEKEIERQVLAPVSTAATADFAGCLAYASTFFKDTNLSYADELLQAALKAQDYLECHEDELFKNPEEIRTGEYGDRNVKDERFLAYAGLYSATKEQKYLDGAKRIWSEVFSLPEEENVFSPKRFFISFGWGLVGAYGVEILINSGLPESEAEFEEILKNEVLLSANRLLEKSEAASFGISIEFTFWGSNGHSCDNAHLLIFASQFMDEEKALQIKKAVQNHLDYILGCNPMNLCYITGAGSASPKNLHHRPSGALNFTMNGMLAGGPAEGLNDEVAKKALGGHNIPPLRCYLDNVGSYSTNEVAIYWNSAFVQLCARCL